MRILTNITTTAKNLNVHSALAFAGIIGPVMLIITDIVAASANPGYSAVEHSISSLALGDLGWVQTVGFLAIGLLVEIFVAGLLYNIRAVRGFHLSIALLVLFGFGLLLIGAFRTDPVGAPDTVEGTIHSLTATVVFWLFPFAILIIAPSLKNDPNWKSIHLYTIVTGILAVIFVVVLGFLQDDISWFGLFERILVGNIIIWVEVAAVRLLYLSVKRSAERY